MSPAVENWRQLGYGVSLVVKISLIFGQKSIYIDTQRKLLNFLNRHSAGLKKIGHDF